MRTNKKKVEIDFLLIFILTYTILAAYLISFWFLFLYLVAGIYVLFNKTKPTKLIYYFCISFIPLLLSFAISNFNSFEHFAEWINKIFGFSVRNKIMDFITNTYDEETKSIINLFIFNYKDKYSYKIYQIIINLSIVYLIVIGGFHLSILQRIIRKTIKKPKILSEILGLMVIFFYTYLLNFSISTSRVLISTICGYLLFWTKFNQYNKTACAGILSLIICPNIITNLGFNLSYLCTFGVIFVFSLNVKNFFLRQILINVLCTLISLPFVVSINHQISLFAVINSLLFSYLISILFIVMLFTFWIKWIYPFQKYMCWFIVNSVMAFNLINVMIKLQSWEFYIQSIYISLFFAGIVVAKNKLYKR